MASRTSSSPLVRGLTTGVDGGLAAVIFAVPFFMSGRHAIGLFVFVLASTLSFVLWSFRQAIRRRPEYHFSGAELVWIGVLALLAIQLIPLPTSILSAISPELTKLLPLRNGQTSVDVGLATWNRISLDPYSTRGALVLAAAYAMLFTVVTQRIKSLADADRILRWVGAAVGLYSVWALYQLFLIPHNTPHFFDVPDFTRTAAARGSFPNPNHFGHFAALGVGPLLYAIHQAWEGSGERRTRRRRRLDEQWFGRFVAPVLLAVTLIAAVLSYSRGAMISVTVALTVMFLVCMLRRVWNRTMISIMAGCLGLCVIAAVWHGGDRVSDELDTLTQGMEGLDNSHIRRTIWTAATDGGRAFPWLGVGGGAHGEVYHAFLPNHLEQQASHADNCYVQFFFEGGFLGLALLAAGILLGGYWSWTAVMRVDEDSRRRTTQAAAAIAGLSASLVHAGFDSIWYVPACSSFALILVAVVARIRSVQAAPPRRPVEEVALRLGWLPVAFAASAVALLMLTNRLPPLRAYPHWQSYLDMSLRSNSFGDDGRTAATSVNPLDVANIDRMLQHLHAVRRLDPSFPRAHVRTAMLLERRFEVLQSEADNAMPLSQFREAALASQFQSKQAQEEWLNRAMGDNRQPLDLALRHARIGLQLCPMYGEAYCSLSSLVFLEGRGAETSRALLDQARLVRPHEGMVLLAAGIQAVNEARYDDAQELLRTVFNQEPKFQRQIIQLFGFTVAPEAMLRMFEPKYEGLKSLYRFYREHRSPEGMKAIGIPYAAELERIAASQTPRHAARNLHYAHQVCREIGRPDEALRLAAAASKRLPRDVAIRRDLGLRLAEAGQLDEAFETLKWCAQRKPQDLQLQNEVARVNRLRLMPAALREDPATGRPSATRR